MKMTVRIVLKRTYPRALRLAAWNSPLMASMKPLVWRECTQARMPSKWGLEAMTAIGIIPRYGGVIIHDCWASYLSYEHCRHGLCGAHLLRELAFIVESNGYAWAKNIKRLLQQTCRRVSRRRRKRLTPREYAALQQHYRNILTRAERELPPIPARHNGKRGRIAKSDAHNLWERLKEHETAVLLFAKDPNVPFTNNRAERDLRMSKVKQKVSGCFRNASSPTPTVASRATCRPWPTKATTLSSLSKWLYPGSCTQNRVSSYPTTKRLRATGSLADKTTMLDLRFSDSCWIGSACESQSANPITNANATFKRAASLSFRDPIRRPTRSRRIVTGLSAMICERVRKPFFSVGSIVTRKSGASTMSEVIWQTITDACSAGRASV